MPSPNLALTPLAAAQAQKHVTVNEALARIDAATNLAVLTRALSDPPPSPQDGARYLIAPGATSGWQGHEGAIAAWDAAAQGWIILAPRPGWRIWIIDEDALLVRKSGAWAAVSDTNPVPGNLLGVNATADPVNRLAVASPAILLTHEGAGMQAKLNKATAADTGALLFQSGFSGRAEFGLVGTDDTTLKTSPDGITFTEALRIPAATARPDFPQGMTLTGGTALTHYSQGTFTPSIDPGGTSSGDWSTATGMSVESAVYTRIGNLVTLRLLFSFDGVPGGDLTDAASQTLIGLPFLPTDTSGGALRDHPGSALLIGSIPNATSAVVMVIIAASGQMFLSCNPPPDNRSNANALIMLTTSYEAA